MPADSHSKSLLLVYTDANSTHEKVEFCNSRIYSYIEASDFIDMRFVQGNASRNYDDGNTIHLACPETYINLPMKTAMMFTFVLQHMHRYRRIVKMDANVVAYTQAMGDEKARALLDQDLLIAELAETANRSSDYSGIRPLVATLNAAAGWAARKNLTIEYSRIFGLTNTPQYFWGKYYEISFQFLEYLGTVATESATEYVDFFPAEDVMIGKIHESWIRQHKTAICSDDEICISEKFV